MVVWEGTLDKVWHCRVERTGDRTGRLVLSRVDDPSVVILDEETGLSYGAHFGPDVADVACWQEKCAAAVDALSPRAPTSRNSVPLLPLSDPQAVVTPERVNTLRDSGDADDAPTDLVYRLRKRAEIRRQISTRKSVQEGQPDRIADLLEEAADEIDALRARSGIV